jgi:hypothetical protein
MRPLAGAINAQITRPKCVPSEFARGNEIDLRLPASLSLMCWPRTDLPVPALPYRGRGAFARSRLWVAGEGESLLSRKSRRRLAGRSGWRASGEGAGGLPALGWAGARITSR